ncbi:MULTISPECIES: DUF6701 domain-containing protein [unclassified Agarivorans]|uniref:DUF6701 domain-containing protein n=1 Tax=unclassified Agarivorans TaxID=2636026 RepID=UPI0026E34AFF|nr:MULTISPECIES: DUF6701 domain-containing protein [unclassified Agarivorans]MDO6686855.1 hypothetical protein [Agarivorans sp. 3_MG-2023]MDO6716652.1 hypothetical protein [Agarivorans sp. 2_MG-2023]
MRLTALISPLLISLLVIPQLALAVDCVDVFTSPIASSQNNRRLEINWLARVYGSNQGRLDIASVDKVSSSDGNTCPDANTDCVASGSLASAGSNVNIEKINNGQSVNVGYQQTVTLGSGSYNTNNFADIQGATQSTINFSSDRNEYFIENVNVGYQSALRLTPGTYWIDGDFAIGQEATLELLGSSGTIKIFVGGNVTAGYQAKLNVNGDPLRLAIYTREGIDLANETESAFIGYARRNIALNYQAELEGALFTQQRDVVMVNESIVRGIANPGEVDFSPLCNTSVTEPLLLQFGSAGAGQNGGTVTFDQTYLSKPLVFLMTPIDANDPNNDGPVAALVTSVDVDKFTWVRQEPPFNSTASKNIEAVDWIAVNEGEHFLEDGTELRAGKISTNTAFPFPDRDYFNVDMPNNLSVVLHQSQSRNNNCWLTTTSEYNNNGIRLAIDNSEAYDFRFFARYCNSQNDSIYYTDLQDETVAYLATEPVVGAITVDNEVINYQFGNSLTHGSGGSTITPQATCDYTTPYQNNLFSSPPILVASKNERRGNNGGWLRRCQHNAADFSMITEEDQYLDNERSHLAESYSYMAFSSNASVAVPGLKISAQEFGLTCDIHEVTIQATLDGQVDQSFVGTVNLSTSSNKGTWSKGNGLGNLVPENNNGKASYGFTAADLGEVSLGLFHPLEGPVTITVVDGTVGDSTLVTFNAYGFEEKLVGAWGENPHKANTEFKLQLTVVGKDPDGTECRPIANYEGQKNLRFWTDYTLPASGTRQLAVKNQSTNNYVDVSTTQALRTAVAINFVDGLAEIDLRYPDVGRLGINFWDEEGSVVDGNTTTLLGSASAELIPDRFEWALIENEVNETNPSSSNDTVPFARAGTPFKSWLAARIANCTPSSVTDSSCDAANFIADTDKLGLKADLASPDSGVLGTFNDGVIVSQIAGIVVVDENEYHEVGSINYSGWISEYLNYTFVYPDDTDLNTVIDYDVSVANTEVGMFYPHHFELSSAVLGAACTLGDFSYIGQKEQKVTWILQAESANGSITENYTDSIYLVNTDFSRWQFNSSSSILGFDDGLEIDDVTAIWSQGIFAQTDEVMAGLLKPVAAQAPVTDGKLRLFYNLYFDDATLLSADIVSDPDAGGFDCGIDSDEGSYCDLGTVPELRHGRIKLNNGFGSELQAIAVTGDLQYFDGTQYIRNTEDACSNLNLAPLDFSPKTDATNATVGGGTSTVSLRSPGIANQGVIWVDFTAPGEGNTGSVDYWFNLDTNLNWLREDWNGNGSFENADDAAGAGQVTFGIFRQSDRVIYRRML